MIKTKSQERPMVIAPSRHPEIRYWTVEHWKALKLKSEDDWTTAIEIFEDRIKYRYLDAVHALQKDDNAHYRQYKQRRLNPISIPSSPLRRKARGSPAAAGPI